MRLLIATALAASLSVASQSPSGERGRPMTIDDLIAAVRVTDPQLSPDGSRVIFVRTATDLKSGDRNADIWTVPADGSTAATPLIGGSKSDNTPRFSPDGRR
jgi:dipeptidyl aminopeptidase/acylaminoacyl peptidase